MIDLTDRDFSDLCADEAVRPIIAEANRNGGRTALTFWTILILGLLMVVAGTVVAFATDQLIVAVLVGSIGVLAVYIIAMLPLVAAGRAIKLPVFDMLARRHGLSYAAEAHAPPVFEEAALPLFDERLTTQSFTDLFRGKDGNDRSFALWQAYLVCESGRSMRRVFLGRIFAFERQNWGKGRILIAPAGAFFSRSRRPGDMKPVTLGTDPPFERAFQVHATIAEEAHALLGPDARRLLLELRQSGKLRVYVGLGDILIAMDGRKGFTPGLGFFFRRGEARIRAMFDDLAGSLRLLGALKASLD